MTRNKLYVLTGISAALFVFLNWAFADNMFNGTFWDSDAIANSAIWTYVMLGLIVVAGVYQAQSLPAEGVAIQTGREPLNMGNTDDPRFWKLLLGNVYFGVLWLPLRFFVGRAWLAAGEHKLHDSAWMDGGTALKGYWTGAVAIPETGSPKISYDWYRQVLQYMLDHEWYTWFAKLIAVGETLVGIGLIVGALVGIAAFFGTLMNFNFMLAGSASTNPVLFGLAVFLVLGWKVAGYFGLDRFLLPALGAPWQMGSLFHEHEGEPVIGHRRAPA